MLTLSASSMIVDAISGGRGNTAGVRELSEAEVLKHQIAEAKIAARAAAAHERGLVAWLVRHNLLSHRPVHELETGNLTSWSEPKLQTSTISTD